MLNQILFEYPAKFLAHGLPENVVRYGAILKDADTGRIVGHMQESGLGQSLIDMVGSGLPSPLSLVSEPINIGTGLYTATKITQLHAMVQTLQVLQVATLGVSLVGVGISVAGFVHMHKRLNNVDQKLDQVLNVITSGFEDQRKARLREHIGMTKSRAQQVKNAAALSEPETEYARLASAISEQAAYFEGEVSFMISGKAKIKPELFWQLTQLLILCNNVRIDCSLRRNELRHALKTSEGIAADYERLFDGLSPVSFEAPLDQGSQLAQALRDVTDTAASKPYLIDHLHTRQIDGREYLQRIEAEEAHPLLIIKAA